MTHGHPPTLPSISKRIIVTAGSLANGNAVGVLSFVLAYADVSRGVDASSSDFSSTPSPPPAIFLFCIPMAHSTSSYNSSRWSRSARTLAAYVIVWQVTKASPKPILMPKRTVISRGGAGAAFDSKLIVAFEPAGDSI